VYFVDFPSLWEGLGGGLVRHIPFLSCRKHQPSPSGFVLQDVRNRSFVDATDQTPKVFALKLKNGKCGFKLEVQRLKLEPSD
jgi:hypothetical protein